MRGKVLLVFMLFIACSGLIFAQSIDEAVKKSVDELVSNVATKISVGIGSITISDTKSTSAFSDYLRTKIDFYASSNKMYKVMSDIEVNEFENETNFSQTRAMNPLGNSGEKKKAAIQGMIEGKFYQVGDDVEVYLSLVATSDGRKIMSSQFTVAAAELEKLKIDLLPPNMKTETELEEKQEILEPFTGENNTFELRVWTGNANYLFHDGEKMSFKVFSDKDCYIKVYYVSVTGERTVIFPRMKDDKGNAVNVQDNFLKANNVLTLPTNDVSFVMGAPYGQESILVVASTQPFELLSEEEKPAKITREIMSRGLQVVSTSMNNSEKPVIATAQFSYTILERE